MTETTPSRWMIRTAALLIAAVLIALVAFIIFRSDTGTVPPDAASAGAKNQQTPQREPRHQSSRIPE